MCTVTFLPNQDQTFFLTSNRDEGIQRPAALLPDWYHAAEVPLLFPKDPQGSGSWIATDRRGRVACLLNGAFEAHEHRPPYRHSRGLVVLDSFGYSSAQEFAEKYDFSGLEPFTLILIDAPQLSEVRWDGEQVHYRPLDFSKPYIWSSAPLYDRQIRQKRKAWFDQWLQQHPDYEAEQIIEFHKFGGEGDPENDLVMQRGDYLKTRSITSVFRQQDQLYMQYEDLDEGTKLRRNLQPEAQTVLCSD